MKDKAFFDTNLIVYLYSEDESDKRETIRNLIPLHESIISVQVVKEFVNTLRKKYNIEWNKIKNSLSEVNRAFIIFPVDAADVDSAITVAEKYRYSFYDSLIIASALKSESITLYSEDLQHNQTIDKKIKIINPFLK